nr:Entactin/nidogen, E/N [cattle, renal tubular basement membrane, Peptide Partial, 12 aa] [Bos taurus]
GIVTDSVRGNLY